MNTIELFAGSQSFSKVAKELNHNTFTSDIKKLDGIDYVCNILDFDVMIVPYIPDVVWASPDCATWSKAAGRIHFDAKSLIPKTEKAKKAFIHVDKTISIIEYFLKLNPKMKYYIENPEGRLQKYLQAGTLYGLLPRLVVIDQCQYGREFQKTTHIFTNDFSWKPKQRCPGRPICNHKENIKGEAPGQKTSLGKLDSFRYYKRAMIPADLCREILIHNEKNQLTN